MALSCWYQFVVTNNVNNRGTTTETTRCLVLVQQDRTAHLEREYRYVQLIGAVSVATFAVGPVIVESFSRNDQITDQHFRTYGVGVHPHSLFQPLFTRAGLKRHFPSESHVHAVFITSYHKDESFGRA